VRESLPDSWESYERSLRAPQPVARLSTIDVTVVMPTYNGRKFLRPALESVARQTYRPFETIVVDDGSTDGSAELAEEMGARVIRLGRSGVCEARNRGVREATTRWIAFLDQDDLWLPNKLERQWCALMAHPDVVMVATDAAKVGPDSRLLLESFLHVDFMKYREMTPTSRINKVDYFADAAEELKHAGWFLLPSAVLASRDALLKVGIFDERVRLNEDVSCFLRVAMRGGMLVVDEPLTGWRIHSTNTHNNHLGMMRGRLSLTKIALNEHESHPEWFVHLLRREYAGLLAQLGRAEMSANNMGAARAVIINAMREGASKPRMALLWLATFMGARNVDALAALVRAHRISRGNAPAA
jgi:glycosyltransferase involved in cell wall biosynthesis